MPCTKGKTEGQNLPNGAVMNELPDEAIVSALLKDLSGLLAKPELMDEGLVGAAEGT